MGSTESMMPNATLFIQLALFFVAYGFLNKFFFKPYLALMEARKAKTSGLKEKAIQEKAQAEKFQQTHEAFMKTERARLSKWMDEERKKISDEERQIISAARTDASNELKAHRTKLSSEAEKARTELGPLVAEYASQIASRLIGRKVKVSPASSNGSSRSAQAETTA